MNPIVGFPKNRTVINSIKEVLNSQTKYGAIIPSFIAGAHRVVIVQTRV